ncbi:MAG TPA: hypothetical protein VGI03_14050 [Verrucomicrobiae bacterium]|jgi:hypothetical protein
MSAPAAKPPLLGSGMSAPTQNQALRRLFLTLFLRGRGARGLNRSTAPKSIANKLMLTLGFYLLFGCIALAMMRQPVFALAVYLHAMTFMFLGMFVAASAGEILFNKEEADILLHRPIDPKTMLWSKIRVLVEVSLWMAGALNLAGTFAGLGSPDGSWFFPIIHAVSTVMEALFCTSCVVLVYQLCLRYCGRERLEGLMTMAQVLVTIGAILSGQVLPRIIFQMNHVLTASESSWWIALLPPAWFAGFDDALAGSGGSASWLLAALAVVVSAAVLWAAFGKLAQDYETGLQTLNETARKPGKQGRRWLDYIIKMPPLCWWSRTPIERASFRLTAAYLFRDRDMKLRIYPGIAPMLIFPFIFLFQGRGGYGGFGVAFAGFYLGLIPLFGQGIIQYSQQWQAADIFRAAPMAGPAPLCHGARRAILCFLTFPVLLTFGILVWLMHRGGSQLYLMLPGIVALPVMALIPALLGQVPLSAPIESAKAASRSQAMFGVMIITGILSYLASFAWSKGWFWQFLSVETIAAAILYLVMRSLLNRIRWKSAE